MAIPVLLLSFFSMLAIGVPVAISLIAASVIYILMIGDIPMALVAHRVINGVDSFTLLAVPFFILAGNLMNTSGITERIYSFALAAVGWLRGGLGHVNVIGSVIFSGMSGTAVADAGGIGTIEIKAMRDHGYDDRFAVGITAASSILGPIIPPSLPLVIYGVVTTTSIGQLFAAGLVPGIVLALFLMATVTWFAIRNGWGRDARFSLLVLIQSFKRAFLALMAPVIVIGGMTFGVFTPTEAAVAGAAYALLLGLFYRSLSTRQIVRVFYDTAETTAVVLFIVAAAAIFGEVLTRSHVAEQAANLILGITDSHIGILLLINLILLIVGLFMDPGAIIMILAPILAPIAIAAGVDPVQFGIIMVFNLMIGLITPPVGMVLFVLARVANMPVMECARACLPFLIPLFITLGIITFVPWVTLWLPTLLFR